jgi:hypothetical protein
MKTNAFARKCKSTIVLALACAAGVYFLTPKATALTKRSAVCFEADNSGSSGGGGPGPRNITVQLLTPESEKPPREVAWLGVSTEESPDALASQLGLQPGDGLVVIFVQPDSPAAKAGLKKNDVLVEFGDQLLVHPGQFRKLVRRQKEGDTIKLTLFRSGQKQLVSATLARTMEHADASEGLKHEYEVRMEEPNTTPNARDSKGVYAPYHQYAGLTRQAVNLEVERSIEAARKALQETLVRNQSLATALGRVDVEALTEGCNTNTTVIVKKNGKAVKTIVKADSNGTYVIVANPKKHLTVHDKDGKLVFDAEIETKQQQEKVPADLWPQTDLMLKEMGRTSNEDRSEGIDPLPCPST